MIFYYSGTGNSAYAAKELSRLIGEKVSPVSIPSVAGATTLDVYQDEYLGFVFPIYAWGVPPIVLQFVEKLPADLFDNRYVWAVCTCGDEAGNAMKHFDKAIHRVSGKSLNMTATLIMPNTYVLLPGFDVDTPQVADTKLHNAPERLQELANVIEARPEEYHSVHTGSVPALRSLVYPLFKKWGVNPRKWNVSSACISCGKCVRVCPVKNISLVREGCSVSSSSTKGARPIWGSNCLSCCACFHICPQRAINYGKATQNKKQYMHPTYRLTYK